MLARSGMLCSNLWVVDNDRNISGIVSPAKSMPSALRTTLRAPSAAIR